MRGGGRREGFLLSAALNVLFSAVLGVGFPQPCCDRASVTITKVFLKETKKLLAMHEAVFYAYRFVPGIWEEW